MEIQETLFRRASAHALQIFLKNKSLKLDDLKNLFLDKHYSLWNKYQEDSL